VYLFSINNNFTFLGTVTIMYVSTIKKPNTLCFIIFFFYSHSYNVKVMKPTKWQKFSYLRGECLQNIYYDQMINHNNIMSGNKTIKDVLIIHRIHLD